MSDFTAGLFEQVADGYDEDVPFFVTFGRRLVAWAGPAADARVPDIGAGRGAVTRALAEARGSTGPVVAGDLSPRMVQRLAATHLPGVQARVLDVQARPARQLVRHRVRRFRPVGSARSRRRPRRAGEGTAAGW